MGKQWKQWQTLFWGAPKSLQMVTAGMKIKNACSLEEKLWQPRQHIKKQRHYFADRVLSSQSYGFSSSNVWMWESDHKESWAPKNWCFWTVVLEEAPESPLDCKEIQSVHPKWNQSWIFIGRTDAEAETQIFFFSFYFIFLTLQYCIGFAIYQHESATGIHVILRENSGSKTGVGQRRTCIKKKNFFFWWLFLLCFYFCFIYLFFFFGVLLLYNAVLVSAVWQTESATCVHISSLSWISFPFGSPQSTE